MGINSRAAIHPDWTGFASATLRGFAHAKIQLIEPNTLSGNTNFEPWTNSTDSTPAVVWEGWVQMQVFRQTLTLEIPAGGMTQVRSVRFTVPMKDTKSMSQIVRRGMTLRISEVTQHADEDVTHFVYTVTSGVGAALAWTRTIEAEVDTSVQL